MLSTAWYELFPGWLLYTDPSVKWFSLKPLVRSWFMSNEKESSLTHLDKLILAVMECDIELVRIHKRSVCFYIIYITLFVFANRNIERLINLNKIYHSFITNHYFVQIKNVYIRRSYTYIKNVI